MALPRLNYYRFKPVDETPSVDVYAHVIDGVAKLYDKTIDKRDALDKSLSSIQSNQHGQKYVGTLTQNVNKSLSNLVDNIQQTGDFGSAENTLRELTSNVQNDKVLQAIKISHDNELKGLDEKQKLTEKGEVMNLAGNYDNWKPLNADGTVNVWKPEYQNVADYHSSAKAFMKDMPTEIQMAVDANQSIPGFMALKQTQRLAANKKAELAPQYLQSYVESQAGKQQAIYVAQKLEGSGLTQEEIQKRVQKEQASTVANALDSREDEVYQEKLQLVADPVYAETVRQRQRSEVREDKQEDFANAIKLREESNIRVAQAKANMKAAALKGQSDNSKVLSTKTSLNSANPNSQRDNVSMFVNPTHVKGFEIIADKPIGDNWDRVLVDKSIDKIPPGARITGFKPQGVMAINNFDPKFDGAWYGQISYTDASGKNERSAMVHVQNTDTSMVNNYKTVSEIARMEQKVRTGSIADGAEVGRVKDVGRLFNDAQVAVDFEVIRNKNGIRVIPVIDDIDDKGKLVRRRVQDIPSNVKKELGLTGVQGNYTSAQLRNLADYYFSQQMQVVATTPKDISGQTQPIQE